MDADASLSSNPMDSRDAILRDFEIKCRHIARTIRVASEVRREFKYGHRLAGHHLPNGRSGPLVACVVVSRFSLPET